MLAVKYKSMLTKRETGLYYGNQRLDTCPAPLESTRLRIPVMADHPAPRVYPKVSSNHPWKREISNLF